MEHYIFFLLNFATFIAMLFVDRKNWEKYFLIIFIGLLLAFVFENFTTYIGLWNYHSEPKVFLFSFYTWLMYIPYLGYCYFGANTLRKYV